MAEHVGLDLLRIVDDKARDALTPALSERERE
jgi:hypothetical protein